MSAIGGHATILGVEDAVFADAIDQGIFTIFKRDTFERTGDRRALPTDVFALSALESICLRAQEDYELFGLVKNSGLA